jgi:hypothetical protein
MKGTRGRGETEGKKANTILVIIVSLVPFAPREGSQGLYSSL